MWMPKFDHASQIFTEVVQERQEVRFILYCGRKSVPVFLILASGEGITCLITSSCPLGWLISSHHWLQSRRRSSLSMLRELWLQERGSWLQMSQQVSLEFCYWGDAWCEDKVCNSKDSLNLDLTRNHGEASPENQRGEQRGEPSLLPWHPLLLGFLDVRQRGWGHLLPRDALPEGRQRQALPPSHQG